MPTVASSNIDVERFRLHRCLERLVELSECERRDEPADLVDVASALDGRATFSAPFKGR